MLAGARSVVLSELAGTCQQSQQEHQVMPWVFLLDQNMECADSIGMKAASRGSEDWRWNPARKSSVVPKPLTPSLATRPGELPACIFNTKRRDKSHAQTQGSAKDMVTTYIHRRH